MKKYIIIAAVALAASAACTKVTVSEAPAQKISFEVASYVPQTKVQGGNFKAEADYFFTNAWYYPTSGDAQHYMDDVKIELLSGAWQPADAYYWPRTGKINFFSYASKNDIATNELNPGDEQKGAKFTITGHTVVADDNIMIADAVYNAGKDDHNADGALVTDDLASGTDSQYNGVPTMFRHLLAQVKFNIGLATKTPTTGTTNFEATVTSASLKSIKNKGTLELTAGAAAGTTLETKAWTPASDGTQVGWTADTAVENLTLSNSTALKLAAGETAGNSELFLDWRSVLPQALADEVVLEITFNLDTKHGNTVYAHEEGIVVSSKLNLAKLSDTETITNWCMNKRYIYNVTIDPVTEVITFDPAVAAWTEATGTIEYKL